MNSWFVKSLGDPMLADESLETIRSFFLSQYEKDKSTDELAVFFRHESSGDVHCEIKVYFSPATSEVAKAFNAMPCKKPSSDGLGLLVGSEESQARLFSAKADS